MNVKKIILKKFMRVKIGKETKINKAFNNRISSTVYIFMRKCTFEQLKDSSQNSIIIQLDHNVYFLNRKFLYISNSADLFPLFYFCFAKKSSVKNKIFYNLIIVCTQVTFFFLLKIFTFLLVS